VMWWVGVIEEMGIEASAWAHNFSTSTSTSLWKHRVWHNFVIRHSTGHRLLYEDFQQLQIT